MRRRYNDFLWLRQRLEETHSTHIIPVSSVLELVACISCMYLQNGPKEALKIQDLELTDHV